MPREFLQLIGLALTALWGAAGAVVIGRAAANSPVTRGRLATIRGLSPVGKVALLAGLVFRYDFKDDTP